MSSTTGNGAVPSADIVSQRRTLTIKAPAADDPRLPAASIIEGNVIDLSSFDGDAHVSMKPWIFAAPGQGLWLWITYDARVIEIMSAHVITAAEAMSGVYATVPRDELAGIKDGTILVVHAAVSFDGATSQPAEGYFPPNAYVLRSSIGSGGGDRLHENFVGVPVGTRPLEPYELPTKTMSLTVINDARFAQSKEDAGISLTIKSVSSASYATFTLARPLWLVILEFKSAQPANDTHLSAKFLNHAGTSLATVALPSRQTNIVYAPHKTESVKSIAITMMTTRSDDYHNLVSISGSYLPM